MGQAKGLAHHPDFVLEEELQGLHQFKLHILRQAAYVVVRFDAVGLQNVGIDGALGQEVDALQLFGLIVEHLNEFLSDDFPLGFGIGDTGQLVQETVHGVHIDQVGVHFVTEDLDHLLRLPFSEQTVVYMNTDQLLANGLDQQGGHHGRVHAAGQSQQHLLAADLRPQLGNLLVDECLSQRGGGDPGHGLRAKIVCHLASSIFFIFWIGIV